MSHYEERLEKDLTAIRQRVVAVGVAVEAAVERAVSALLRLDRADAADVILGDHPINRETRAIDHLCHAFVARHLPSAGHLRFVSAVLRLTVALERIGDYAVTVARESVQLTQEPPGTVVRDIEMVSAQARRMLTQAMKAFEEGSAERARGTKALAGQSKNVNRKVFDDLIAEGESDSRPVADLFGLLLTLNRLDRIGDQAKNICEETIFAATGETKQPKVYRVLFVDRTNGVRSLLAEAMARKAYPESGKFASAGWAPADGIDASVVDFMDARGLGVADLAVTALPQRVDDLDEYHVIVDLDGNAREHLVKVPFQTVLVSWNSFDDVRGAESLEAVYRDLAGRIRDLMETLRGPQAS